jgi:hypothetical protein
MSSFGIRYQSCVRVRVLVSVTYHDFRLATRHLVTSQHHQTIAREMSLTRRPLLDAFTGGIVSAPMSTSLRFPLFPSHAVYRPWALPETPFELVIRRRDRSRAHGIIPIQDRHCVDPPPKSSFPVSYRLSESLPDILTQSDTDEEIFLLKGCR